MTEPIRDTQGASAPPPPPAPTIAPAAAEADTQRPDAQPAVVAARPSRKGARRRPSTSTIVAIAATVVVAAGAFFGMRALDMAQSRPVDDRLSDASSQTASGTAGTAAKDANDEAEQKQVKADIQQALDALADDENGQFHAYVAEFVQAYDEGTSLESYSLADIGISADDLSSRLRSEFECSVVKADVYNGMAWVDVDVTSKNMSSVVESFARAVAGDALTCDNEQEYKQRLKEALLETLDKQKPRTVRVLLTLERDGDGWSLGQSDIETLLGAAWYS